MGFPQYLHCKSTLLFFAVIVLAWCSPHLSSGDNRPFRIGVVAYRGHDQANKTWSLTADYLTAKLKKRPFVIVPLHLDDMKKAVKRRELDFVLTNPDNYVKLEAAYGVTRIATMLVKSGDRTLKSFGAVVFTKADRKDINSLDDLKGKSFAAVEAESFGGWLMAWREFKERGIDPYADIGELLFTGFPQDRVVRAVRDGRVAAGTVRTGVLEAMVAEGALELRDIKIVNPQQHDGFPLLHSTRLYPEWAFAKLSHTPDELAEDVVIALLGMQPDSAAARAASITGWTIPQNYEPVHDLMLDLRIGPYAQYGKLTFGMFLQRYRYAVLSTAVAMILMVLFALSVHRINRRLILVTTDLRRTRDTLEIQVRERTAELLDTNKALTEEIRDRRLAQEERERLIQELQDALANIKTLRGLVPICSGCKKIRNDRGFWEQIEAFMSEHTDAEFSHGICPECARKLYPDHYKEPKDNRADDERS